MGHLTVKKPRESLNFYCKDFGFQTCFWPQPRANFGQSGLPEVLRESLEPRCYKMKHDWIVKGVSAPGRKLIMIHRDLTRYTMIG